MVEVPEREGVEAPVSDGERVDAPVQLEDLEGVAEELSVIDGESVDVGVCDAVSVALTEIDAGMLSDGEFDRNFVFVTDSVIVVLAVVEELPATLDVVDGDADLLAATLRVIDVDDEIENEPLGVIEPLRVRLRVIEVDEEPENEPLGVFEPLALSVVEKLEDIDPDGEGAVEGETVAVAEEEGVGRGDRAMARIEYVSATSRSDEFRARTAFGASKLAAVPNPSDVPWIPCVPPAIARTAEFEIFVGDMFAMEIRRMFRLARSATKRKRPLGSVETDTGEPNSASTPIPSKFPNRLQSPARTETEALSMMMRNTCAVMVVTKRLRPDGSTTIPSGFVI